MPMAASFHPMPTRHPPLSLPSVLPLKPSLPFLPLHFRSQKLTHPSPSLRLLPLAAPSRNAAAVKPPASAEAPVVVSDDESYGKKQVIILTPQLYEYVLANVREPPVLRELREETSGMRGSQMQVSPDQAQLLAMLVQILGAVKCIEIGVYTGYSSLAIALALPDSGNLVACERDANSLEIAKKYYERAGVSHKVEVKHALAVDTLKSLIQKGESSSQVRSGGLIIFDNVLWHGKVSDPQVIDKKTISLRNFNQKILDDKRVSISMVPIGDGMTICRKRD